MIPVMSVEVMKLFGIKGFLENNRRNFDKIGEKVQKLRCLKGEQQWSGQVLEMKLLTKLSE